MTTAVETVERTAGEIRAALSSLEAFHAYLAEWPKKTKGRTQDGLWIVRGRLALSNGHEPGEMIDRDPVMAELAPVVHSTQVLAAIPKLVLSWGWPMLQLPAPGDTCALCHRRWTIDNVFDRTVWRGLLFHERCASIQMRQDERTEISKLLIEAGIAPVMNEIPNQYWKSDSHGPWFEVALPTGDLIIGSRKRVLSIEWKGDDCPVDFTTLFPDENVTKERGLIHAWSEGKAIEYLTRIRAALDLRAVAALAEAAHE